MKCNLQVVVLCCAAPATENSVLHRAFASFRAASLLRIARIAGVSVILTIPAMMGAAPPAQAADCWARPNHAAPKGARWAVYRDLASGHRCWVLVDADSDTPFPLISPSTLNPFSGQLFQSSKKAATAARPHKPRPHSDHKIASPATPAPAALAPVSREPTAPPDEPAVSAPAAVVATPTPTPPPSDPHQMTENESNALFHEFLQWQETQKVLPSAKP